MTFKDLVYSEVLKEVWSLLRMMKKRQNLLKYLKKR